MENSEEMNTSEVQVSDDDEENILKRMFKTESTKEKYGKFVGFQGVKRKHPEDSQSGLSSSSIGNVLFKCLLCNKTLSVGLGSSSNIRKHLKVSI